MKKRILVGSLAAWCSALILAAAPLGTTFTYQGRLNDNGTPATGLYDLRFTIYDALAGGNAVSGPLTNAATGVTNGLFTVRLDFGTNVFTGDARWLEMSARLGGAAAPFEVMTPRNELTPAPFAFFAATAANLSGTVPLAQLPASLVTNCQTGLTLGGTFTGNGGGLSNLSASAIVGWALGNAWTLGGNNVAPGQFLGSTNDQPLELWVSGRRALRLEPVDGGFPNVLGGDSINTIASGVGSATIAGGADQHIGASADGTFLGGGYLNTVNEGAVFATIAGGTYNLIDAYATHSTIGGGELNTIEAGANHSLIAGGFQNSVSNGTMFGVIAGGQANTNGGSRSVIGGGLRNFIQMSCEDGASTLGGGSYNQILGFSDYATITGGSGNTIGSGLLEGFTTAATIGGGTQNRISEGAEVSLIAGGINNSVSTNARSAVIGGGGNNVIAASATNAVIAGGQGNTVAAGAFDSIIAGGANNQISGLSQSRLFSPKIVLPPATTPTPAASRSVIGGGFGNVNSSPASVIAGGWQNRIGVNANNATVAGGANNQIVSSAWNAAIGGGENNTIAAGATNATIPGGSGNSVAAKGGFAAGRDAHVQPGHDGSFVWGDGTGGAYTTGSNRFEALATGGANFYTGKSSLTGIEGVGLLNAPGATAIYGVAFDNDGNGVVGQADSGYLANGVMGWAADGSGGFFAGRNGVVANGTEVGLSASAPSGGYAAVFDGEVRANGAVTANSLAVSGPLTASNLGVTGTVTANSLGVSGPATAASLGVSGTVTAGSFVGDGSTLTGVAQKFGTVISSLPYTITKPGLYYLTNNLELNAMEFMDCGITINASNVTLNLNGFTISCAGDADYPTGISIGEPGARKCLSATILNGCVRSFYYSIDGSYLQTNSVIHISGILLTDCASGIDLNGSGYSVGVVDNCTAITTGTGIWADIVSNSKAISLNGISARVVNNCVGISIGGVGNLANNQRFGIAAYIVNNSYGETDSTGVSAGLYAHIANNCRGVSTSASAGDKGGPYGLNALSATGCRGEAVAGTGVHANIATTCTGASETGTGLLAEKVATSCLGQSKSGLGLKSFMANGCWGESDAGASVDAPYKYNMPP